MKLRRGTAWKKNRCCIILCDDLGGAKRIQHFTRPWQFLSSAFIYILSHTFILLLSSLLYLPKSHPTPATRTCRSVFEDAAVGQAGNWFLDVTRRGWGCDLHLKKKFYPCLLPFSWLQTAFEGVIVFELSSQMGGIALGGWRMPSPPYLGRQGVRPQDLKSAILTQLPCSFMCRRAQLCSTKFLPTRVGPSNTE